MARALAITLLAGCYAPTFEAGTPCNTACPGDLVCIDRVCRAPGFVPDAAPDGPPGDRDGDGLRDDVDNCPDVANPDQHDEDADHLGDACDPCPHLAGDAADRDGDGVGDACDPQPDLPKQRIRFFDPFTHVDSAWSLGPGFTIASDAMHANVADTDVGGDLAMPTTALRIITGGRITTAGTMSPHQISLSFGQASNGTYHYVQLYDDTTSGGAITISRYDGTSFPELAGASYMPPIKTGAWAMQIDESVRTHTIALAGVLGGAPFPALSAQAPALVDGTNMTLYVNHVAATFDYFVVIETLP